MQRNAAVIIGLSVVTGFLILGLLARPAPRGGPDADGDVGRYQAFRANDVTLGVIDTRTGRVWTKFVGSNEGPARWSEDGPDLSPPVVQQQAAPQAPAPPKK